MKKGRWILWRSVLGITMGGLMASQGLAAEQWSSVRFDGQGQKAGDLSDSAREMEDRLKQVITLEYKDADLSSVLRSLAWTYKINIVTSSDIKGKVSINLQDISVEKALDAILTINGLVYSKRDGVIFVSLGDSSVVEVTTDVIPLKYLAVVQAQNLTRKLLSSKGDVKNNEAGNSLIVTDYAANITRIKELITKVDVAPKQVLIEAKIVDITSNDLKTLGVTWAADWTPTMGGLFHRSTTQEELKAGLSLAQPNSSLGQGQFVLNTLALKGINVTATIDALVRDGKANLLASPSIAVINGQEARIVIGERYPYVERTQTPTGTTETTKFVDIGTTLKVNPQINDDGYITLAIHPEVSSLLASLDAGPRITTREADTTVRVKEGETLVIGGLIKQADSQNKDKVPVVGNVPFLGALFSRSSVDREQTELAVFITPRILFSREETNRLGKKKEQMDSYTLLDETGPLTVVERIFEKAVHLDHGEGYESVRKDEGFRKAQALSHYELIYKEFPDSPRAPQAKYLAARIYLNYYKNSKKAMEALAALISDYPQSPYADEARRIYADLEKKEQKNQPKAADKAQKKNNDRSKK